MKLSATLISFASLALTTIAQSLPACSADSGTPCSCPSGTEYQQSATFAVIGALGTDVKDLLTDFYNAAWSGVVPIATHGPDNQVGSIRVLKAPTGEGTYILKEQLDLLLSTPNGSLIYKYEQAPRSIPVEYHAHNGSFSGYWVTLESESVFQYEQAIVWSAYACLTGHPLDFAAFHESALNNATSILQAEGKILGTNQKPNSIQDF